MKTLLLLLLAFTTYFSSAQEISNKLVFSKGQKIEIEMKINSSIQSMGATTVDATITRILDVQDLVNGNAVIEHKIGRIQANVVSMMGNESFDSENESDMKGSVGKKLEKSLKNKYTMTVDGTGRVVSVRKDDGNPNTEAGTPEPNLLGTLLAGVVDGIEVPEIGSSTEFRILPDEKVKQGDTWTDTSAGKKVVYTLSGITDSTILIAFTEEVKINRTEEMMGMEIKISSNEKTTGNITLNRATGLLKNKTANTETEGNTEMMGQTVPMTSSSTKKWVVSSE